MKTATFFAWVESTKPQFPLMTLLITLALMVGHMSAQMMMAENATVY